ncbi:beta strand repeat-containing protein [Oceanospirillum sediminis]|uniref:Calcium-binding protein n=1 Tax=Oceanospirillum sediminis TaxID=2760088 RepID=A0A839ITB4_9GAMM|nr:calcium-binding protein [Oceanospirillum sediminis]MBB1488208.1 calcium-binding protein [Oceanospirillum sediminis]
MSNDTVNVQRGIVGAAAGDDTYVLSANLIDDNAEIRISDVEGSNTVQLIGGLTIASARIAGDTAQLTLSNGAVVTVLGASTMSYVIGGNPLAGVAGVTKDYDAFVADILGTTVPTDGSVVDGVNSGTIQDDGTIDTNTSTPAGPSFDLTNGSDKATANIFNSDMVFTPDGSDRILSLQDEDELTGEAGRTDNTLNAEIGNTNADEGTTPTVTPQLNNIQIVNLEWTGNTTTVDLRYADDVSTVNIDKITADANTVTVNNITTPAANLRVADAADATTTVTFNYQRGVLAGTETANLELNDVLANTITQNALSTGANTEGFEAVNLHAVNGVAISALSVNEMETLTITGSDYLDIVNLTAASGAGANAATEFMNFTAGALANPKAVGLLDLDASAFTGTLTLDVSTALGGFQDPGNSGEPVHTSIQGGTGDDTFWTGTSFAATSTTNRDTLDGGTGANTLVTTAGIAGDAAISNVQTLELRQQGTDTVNDDAATAQTVDFDAFDADLTKVIMRDEFRDATGDVGGGDFDGATFNLVDLGADLASNGNLVLRHSITDAVAGTDAVVNAQLKDASGNDDTVAITVENDLNTGTTFDYTLNATGASAAETVESVTIVDADTESNIVNLTQAQNHTGTVTLSGGVADQSYTVDDSLVAATVDASAQLSDLRLTVGKTDGTAVTQDIKLGAGNDILTFENIDDFQAVDSISDAGGSDIVRAAFSDDSALSLTDIEGLHIIATENVELGMANADVDQLVILADIAADGNADASPTTAEPFNINGAGPTDIITLTDTALTELNFQADLDTDDRNTAAARAVAEAAGLAAGAVGTAAYDAAYKGVLDDAEDTANFNGVTLANNTATALTVNINSGLDDVIFGAQAYNLGQLTAHGITSMDIKITDEDDQVGGANAVTTINNIYAKNMASLTISAADDVDLNTVSGAALNNSLTTLDASQVGGDVTADVISLGDNAKVTLANGDHTFSALGSAGKNISITAGNGDNDLTGSAQSDTITTGSGWDTIHGDRGDNVITAGAGNDIVTAKDGNDTVDLGTGIDSFTDNLNTGINASLATNTVAMSGGVAAVAIDVAGDGAGVGDVDQMLAVGAGSDLRLSWTGAALSTGTAVLDGRVATTFDDGTAAPNLSFAGTANSDLYILTDTAGGATAEGVTFSGGAGNDVALLTAADDFLTFSGGAGNDAAVGGGGTDLFNGGAGADQFVLQNTATIDGNADVVSIADGESTASGWDVIYGFDAGGVALATPVAAATAGTNSGDDKLNLDTTTIAALDAGGANGVDGDNAGVIQSHRIGNDGVITFDTDDTDAFSAVVVGTGANQISLADALAYLAANIDGGATVMFNYDANGDLDTTDAEDAAFVFQDGVTDTVVQLVGGNFTGLEAAGAGTVNLIEIA